MLGKSITSTSFNDMSYKISHKRISISLNWVIVFISQTIEKVIR